MNEHTHSLYYVTCTVCEKIASVIKNVAIAILNFAESTGRARAASQLANLGLYEEAKALMLEGKNKND